MIHPLSFQAGIWCNSLVVYYFWDHRVRCRYSVRPSLPAITLIQYHESRKPSTYAKKRRSQKLRYLCPGLLFFFLFFLFFSSIEPKGPREPSFILGYFSLPPGYTSHTSYACIASPDMASLFTGYFRCQETWQFPTVQVRSGDVLVQSRGHLRKSQAKRLV